MIRILLIAFCLSSAAQAVEVGGVTLADSIHPGNRSLLLNGAGVRSKLVFDLYVAALYLEAKKTSAAAVLNDAGEKRIALHLMRAIEAEDLLQAFNKAIVKNHTNEEVLAMKPALHEFEMIFNQAGKLKKGDVVAFDYRHDKGTGVAINGVEQGVMVGASFYAALLKIWLGDQPAQADLKLKLLGDDR
ncbi:MAG: chalcone isomerase family protein [Gallionella sp.]|nr:chalcone isomerase family protein [Gallionella sp.]